MSVYALDELMKQTRKLAADYYAATQQTLPISSELARYDACRLMTWAECREAQKGVDALAANNMPIQIKSRVIFEDKPGLRIGQINPDGDWQSVALVLYDRAYEPQEIFLASRLAIYADESSEQDSKRKKRGAMSVAKFKKLADCIWSANA